jgi:hypothetical protein
VLKLEREQGARVELAVTSGGRTFSVQHLRDLMLTERTKVFKVGLFVQTGADLASIDGAVCDIYLVRAHLRRIEMAFESGVAVLASPENIGEQVKITELANGQTKVEVTDRLRKMTGRT